MKILDFRVLLNFHNLFSHHGGKFSFGYRFNERYLNFGPYVLEGAKDHTNWSSEGDMKLSYVPTLMCNNCILLLEIPPTAGLEPLTMTGD